MWVHNSRFYFHKNLFTERNRKRKVGDAPTMSFILFKVLTDWYFLSPLVSQRKEWRLVAVVTPVSEFRYQEPKVKGLSLQKNTSCKHIDSWTYWIKFKSGRPKYGATEFYSRSPVQSLGTNHSLVSPFSVSLTPLFDGQDYYLLIPYLLLLFRKTSIQTINRRRLGCWSTQTFPHRQSYYDGGGPDVTTCDLRVFLLSLTLSLVNFHDPEKKIS